jgi:integrase
VVRLLDRTEDEISAIMADEVLKLLSRIFNWHATRSNTFRSPLVRGMARAETKSRDRILDDRELHAVWLATEAESSAFGPFIRFLLLTCARRDEVAFMTWHEVKDGVWVLPEERSKTKSEVTRPLSTAAQALLDSLPRIAGCKYVFTGNGRSAFGGLGRRKAKLDAASGVDHWWLHDLRRTSRSLLSRAGVSVDVSERCLGHAIGGVRAVYDRHSFIPEMRNGYERLAALIEGIVRPQANVIPMRG